MRPASGLPTVEPSADPDPAPGPGHWPESAREPCRASAARPAAAPRRSALVPRECRPPRPAAPPAPLRRVGSGEVGCEAAGPAASSSVLLRQRATWAAVHALTLYSCPAGTELDPLQATSAVVLGRDLTEA